MQWCQGTGCRPPPGGATDDVGENTRIENTEIEDTRGIAARCPFHGVRIAAHKKRAGNPHAPTRMASYNRTLGKRGHGSNAAIGQTLAVGRNSAATDLLEAVTSLSIDHIAALGCTHAGAKTLFAAFLNTARSTWIMHRNASSVSTNQSPKPTKTGSAMRRRQPHRNPITNRTANLARNSTGPYSRALPILGLADPGPC